MARFSKSAMIEYLADRIQYSQQRNAFDPRNGTAQLWPRNATQADKDLIDRAVEYGRYAALSDLRFTVEYEGVP